MKIVVIIPTYNESGSIGQLIDSLESEFKYINNHELSILLVDANSPDGTADLIRSKNKIYSNINLLVEREKRGLGITYITGINYAVKKLNADAFIEFDGDFQHDPKDLKRLIAELDRGYDYVIGSRYVEGGQVPKGWSFGNRVLSKYGSLFIKFILSLPTKDNTSGLKLTRVQGFIDKLPLDEHKIFSRRHAYKIHLLYIMISQGARVKEIPIKFLSREKGDSKSTYEDVIESLKVVFKIYFSI